MVLEHGIGGAAYAAPIARDIMLECQKRDPSRTMPTRLAETAARDAVPATAATQRNSGEGG